MNKSPITRTLKPFIKWAGGKTQFLEIINLLLLSQKAQNNEINFLWILKSVKELLKEVYLVNRDFMFTIASFGEWLARSKGGKNN